MTAYALAPWCPQQFFDANGDPLSSGTAYFYAPGTTTGQQTYSDTSGTLNANPGVPLNAQGRPTSGAIYLNVALGYKLVLKDSGGVTIATYDPVYTPPTSVSLYDTDLSNTLSLVCGSNLTADRTLTLLPGDASRTITLSGNPTLADWFDQAVKTTSSPTFVNPTMASPIVSTLLNLTGGQVAFPATQVASSGANVLDDYEEGTWTPSDGSGASLTLTVNNATYIKVGQLVYVSAYLTYPATANGSAAKLAGLPFAASGNQATLALGWTDKAATFLVMVTASASTVEFYVASATALTNANLTTVAMRFSGCYRATA